MQAGGMPEWYADDLVKLQEIYGRGYASAVSDVVERVTGRKPRRFEEFVRDHRTSFDTGGAAPKAREAGTR
jgi:hypothetical protein